ncbi:hypothetical protein C8R44DRAFT_731414 [Mycena epipterygia]|nr:hypothetical protein C8R44DRAFT_731414 [Mycena epipterygia]
MVSRGEDNSMNLRREVACHLRANGIYPPKSHDRTVEVELAGVGSPLQVPPQMDAEKTAVDREKLGGDWVLDTEKNSWWTRSDSSRDSDYQNFKPVRRDWGAHGDFLWIVPEIRSIGGYSCCGSSASSGSNGRSREVNNHRDCAVFASFSASFVIEYATSPPIIFKPSCTRGITTLQAKAHVSVRVRAVGPRPPGVDGHRHPKLNNSGVNPGHFN